MSEIETGNEHNYTEQPPLDIEARWFYEQTLNLPIVPGGIYPLKNKPGTRLVCRSIETPTDHLPTYHFTRQVLKDGAWVDDPEGADVQTSDKGLLEACLVLSQEHNQIGTEANSEIVFEKNTFYQHSDYPKVALYYQQPLTKQQGVSEIQGHVFRRFKCNSEGVWGPDTDDQQAFISDNTTLSALQPITDTALIRRIKAESVPKTEIIEGAFYQRKNSENSEWSSQAFRVTGSAIENGVKTYSFDRFKKNEAGGWVFDGQINIDQNNTNIIDQLSVVSGDLIDTLMDASRAHYAEQSLDDMTPPVDGILEEEGAIGGEDMRGKLPSFEELVGDDLPTSYQESSMPPPPDELLGDFSPALSDDVDPLAIVDEKLSKEAHARLARREDILPNAAFLFESTDGNVKVEINILHIEGDEVTYMRSVNDGEEKQIKKTTEELWDILNKKRAKIIKEGDAIKSEPTGDFIDVSPTPIGTPEPFAVPSLDAVPPSDHTVPPAFSGAPLPVQGIPNPAGHVDQLSGVLSSVSTDIALPPVEIPSAIYPPKESVSLPPSLEPIKGTIEISQSKKSSVFPESFDYQDILEDHRLYPHVTEDWPQAIVDRIPSARYASVFIDELRVLKNSLEAQQSLQSGEHALRDKLYMVILSLDDALSFRTPISRVLDNLSQENDLREAVIGLYESLLTLTIKRLNTVEDLITFISSLGSLSFGETHQYTSGEAVARVIKQVFSQRDPISIEHIPEKFGLRAKVQQFLDIRIVSAPQVEHILSEERIEQFREGIARAQTKEELLSVLKTLGDDESVSDPAWREGEVLSCKLIKEYVRRRFTDPTAFVNIPNVYGLKDKVETLIKQEKQKERIKEVQKGIYYAKTAEDLQTAINILHDTDSIIADDGHVWKGRTLKLNVDNALHNDTYAPVSVLGIQEAIERIKQARKSEEKESNDKTDPPETHFDEPVPVESRINIDELNTQFVIGRIYKTKEGTPARLIAKGSDGRWYFETGQISDNTWRSHKNFSVAPSEGSLTESFIWNEITRSPISWNDPAIEVGGVADQEDRLRGEGAEGNAAVEEEIQTVTYKKLSPKEFLKVAKEIPDWQKLSPEQQKMVESQLRQIIAGEIYAQARVNVAEKEKQVQEKGRILAKIWTRLSHEYALATEERSLAQEALEDPGTEKYKPYLADLIQTAQKARLEKEGLKNMLDDTEGSLLKRFEDTLDKIAYGDTSADIYQEFDRLKGLMNKKIQLNIGLAPDEELEKRREQLNQFFKDIEEQVLWHRLFIDNPGAEYDIADIAMDKWNVRGWKNVLKDRWRYGGKASVVRSAATYGVVIGLGSIMIPGIGVAVAAAGISGAVGAFGAKKMMEKKRREEDELQRMQQRINEAGNIMRGNVAEGEQNMLSADHAIKQCELLLTQLESSDDRFEDKDRIREKIYNRHRFTYRKILEGKVQFTNPATAYKEKIELIDLLTRMGEVAYTAPTQHVRKDGSYVSVGDRLDTRLDKLENTINAVREKQTKRAMWQGATIAAFMGGATRLGAELFVDGTPERFVMPESGSAKAPDPMSVESVPPTPTISSDLSVSTELPETLKEPIDYSIADPSGKSVSLGEALLAPQELSGVDLLAQKVTAGESLITVKEGDTLWKILRTKFEEDAEFNALTPLEKNRQIGQFLIKHVYGAPEEGLRLAGITSGNPDLIYPDETIDIKKLLALEGAGGIPTSAGIEASTIPPVNDYVATPASKPELFEAPKTQGFVDIGNTADVPPADSLQEVLPSNEPVTGGEGVSEVVSESTQSELTGMTPESRAFVQSAIDTLQETSDRVDGLLDTDKTSKRFLKTLEKLFVGEGRVNTNKLADDFEMYTKDMLTSLGDVKKQYSWYEIGQLRAILDELRPEIEGRSRFLGEDTVSDYNKILNILLRRENRFFDVLANQYRIDATLYQDIIGNPAYTDVIHNLDDAITAIQQPGNMYADLKNVFQTITGDDLSSLRRGTTALNLDRATYYSQLSAALGNMGVPVSPRQVKELPLDFIMRTFAQHTQP